MPARPTARSPSPTSKRTLISRIKAPFGPKARLFSEFFIQPDDPHRVYGPGDVITGSVVLKVTRPFSVTHIVVCLHGYSQVFKTPNSPGESYKQYNQILASGKTKRTGGYYGNGFVSLFEDEITLCGDGRLGEGTYQFNFELIFPRQHLPSSIDFERGTVSYMITATMTRPTAISPTSSCDRRVNFQEDIDVAPLSQPKPRVITLEPILQRSKTMRKVKRTATGSTEISVASTRNTDGTDGTVTESGTQDGKTDSGIKRAGSPRGGSQRGDSQRGGSQKGDSQKGGSQRGGSQRGGTQRDAGSQRGESQVDMEPPQSPSPSDVSFDTFSGESSAGGGSAIDSAAPSAKTGESRTNDDRKAYHHHQHHHPAKKQPITATIEMGKAGFLRGDNIPVKVFLTHTRAIKSLRGVIVTLYRQARVDMHPALPVVRGGDDDVYPRSRTGLSGLSLSSAGSTHTFRKDLDQQFASLIVNPATLQAEVKAVLRVPDDAFPSIASVPGAMISFKYYVEIILDIQGKLAGLDKFLPTANVPNGGLTISRPESTGGTFVPWGGHLINTEDIRREKSVVFSVFEIVVGTRDSERPSSWKQPETDVTATTSREVVPTNGAQSEDSAYHSQRNSEQEVNRPQHWDQYWRHHPPEIERQIPDEPPPAIDFPLPPEPENEEHISEKERFRRAEARLLPSAPPEAAGPSSADHLAAPSAPVLSMNRPLPPTPATPSAPPAFDFGIDHRASSRTSVPCPPEHGEPSAPAYQRRASPQIDSDRPSAPAYAPGETSTWHATDDKEELRRRELETARSAPGAPPSEEAPTSAGAPSAPSAPSLPPLPSAPRSSLLVDEHHLGFSAPDAHALPAYER